MEGLRVYVLYVYAVVVTLCAFVFCACIFYKLNSFTIVLVFIFVFSDNLQSPASAQRGVGERSQ